MDRVKLALLVSTMAACRPGPRHVTEAGARSTAETRPFVEVSLLAGATHVVPGEEMELAVLFKVAPGWHIYWINPGESGLATRVEVVAPEFSSPSVGYPGPQSLRSANVVSYGYAGETALFARLVALFAQPPKTVTFTARASWLVCREECLPGHAVLSLEVPVASRSSSAPANVAALAPHRARLPSETPPVALSHQWREEKDHVVLTLSLPGAEELELFPFANQPALYRDQEPGDDGRLAVNFLRSAPTRETAVAGVLRVVDGGQTRYYSISIPWLH